MGCNKCGKNSLLEWHHVDTKFLGFSVKTQVFLLCEDCLEKTKQADADKEKAERNAKNERDEKLGLGGCLGCGGFFALALIVAGAMVYWPPLLIFAEPAFKTLGYLFIGYLVVVFVVTHK
jgi:hypothetical protein